MPPHGGHRTNRSQGNGSTSRKSLLRMYRLYKLTPQTPRLFLSISSLAGSRSLAMYFSARLERWTVTPPTPQKGSKMVSSLIFEFMSRSLRQREIGSATTEYQLSRSSWMPSSNFEKRKNLRMQYLRMALSILRRCLSSFVPQSYRPSKQASEMRITAAVSSWSSRTSWGDLPWYRSRSKVPGTSSTPSSYFSIFSIQRNTHCYMFIETARDREDLTSRTSPAESGGTYSSIFTIILDLSTKQLRTKETSRDTPTMRQTGTLTIRQVPIIDVSSFAGLFPDTHAKQTIPQTKAPVRKTTVKKSSRMRSLRQPFESIWQLQVVIVLLWYWQRHLHISHFTSWRCRTTPSLSSDFFMIHSLRHSGWVQAALPLHLHGRIKSPPSMQILHSGTSTLHSGTARPTSEASWSSILRVSFLDGMRLLLEGWWQILLLMESIPNIPVQIASHSFTQTSQYELDHPLALRGHSRSARPSPLNSFQKLRRTQSPLRRTCSVSAMSCANSLTNSSLCRWLLPCVPLPLRFVGIGGELSWCPLSSEVINLSSLAELFVFQQFSLTSLVSGWISETSLSLCSRRQRQFQPAPDSLFRTRQKLGPSLTLNFCSLMNLPSSWQTTIFTSKKSQISHSTSSSGSAQYRQTDSSSISISYVRLSFLTSFLRMIASANTVIGYFDRIFSTYSKSTGLPSSSRSKRWKHLTKTVLISCVEKIELYFYGIQLI